MKKITFLLLMVVMFCYSTTLLAQIRKVPAAVTEAFKAKYPSASNVEWKDKLTYFQAAFNQEGGSYKARFTSKGEWDQTEKTIEEKDLPGAVKEGLEKSKYSGREVGPIVKIEFKDGHIEYRLFVKRNAMEKKYLYFNEEGKLLRDAITI